MSDQGDKDAYLRKYQARLDQLGARISEVQAKMREASADAEIEYRSKLDQMRAKRDSLAAKMEEMRAAGQESWSQLRQGVERASDELDAAWRAIKDRLG